MSAHRGLIALLGQSTGGGGGGGSVLPSTGLIADYNAAVGITLSGSNISAVADQSGQGNNLSIVSGTVGFHASGGSGPNGAAYGTHASGGILKTSTASGLSAGDFSIWVVWSPFGGGGNGSGPIFGYMKTGGVWWALNQVSPYHIGGNDLGAGGVEDSGTAFSGTSSSAVWDIILATRTSGTIRFYKNGPQIGSTFSSTGASTGTIITLGDNPNLGNSCNGSWARCGIYDHALSSTDRTSLFSALGSTYGITVI